MNWSPWQVTYAVRKNTFGDEGEKIVKQYYFICEFVNIPNP